VIFVFTSIPLINRATPLLALVSLVGVLTLRFVPRKLTRIRTLLWSLFVLSLIGSTGWFYSPFFFALYLVAIGLAFAYSPAVSIAFTFALIIMFVFSIGEVNPTYDFLTLLSLLTVIPISIALRKSYLLVKEEEKGILILEKDDKTAATSSLDSVLSNKINKIGTQLRQPLTYLKQGLNIIEEENLSAEERSETMERMRKAVEEMFALEKRFERSTTKNAILSRTKNNK